MKRLFLIFLFLAIPSWSFAESLDAGFVQGLWYSSDQILEGVPVRVYAALRNNTPHDLTGTVRFMDNGKRIGSAPVSALSGRLIETWMDWTPSYGDHSLSVSLNDAELHAIGGETIQMDVASITVSDTQTADHDTDKDGIGNAKDPDDDNDGVSDAEELARGTNPLVANPKPKEVPETVPEKTSSSTPQTPHAEIGPGLEAYIDDGTTDTILSSITDKVGNAKQAIDAYRTERNGELTKSNESNIPTDNATITRSKIETKNTLLGSLVSGAGKIIQNIWTFILWLLSRALTYPALMQVLTLVSILYFFYRIARRLGGRPN